MMPLREYPAILSRLLLVVVLALIGLPQQSHGADMAEASQMACSSPAISASGYSARPSRGLRRASMCAAGPAA